MKKSLRIKLCVTGFCLILLFVILNILFTYLWMSPFSMRLTANQMEKIADAMKSQMDLSEDVFQNYIEEIDEDYNTTVTIFDSEKKIIATTSSVKERKNKLGAITERLFDENADALEKGKAVRYFKEKNVIRIKNDEEINMENGTEIIAQKIGRQDNNNESIRIFMIKKVGENRYVVLYRTFRSFYNATFAAILFDILAGGVIIIIGIFVVWRLSNYVVKPVKEITGVAENIANLQFDTKAPEHGKDEIGQLGISINRMSSHLESNLVQLQEDIENRKKLVRNLSHEIKSPVAVIMGYADRMKAVISKNPEKAVQYCEIISNESARIDILVKEMLDFSKMEQRMEELNLETIPVKSLLEKVVSRIKEENFEMAFSIQIKGGEDCIAADYGLMERAIYNLVNNAVSHGASETLAITITGQSVEGKYVFRVHNTGSHIPEEELPYIWDAFYKVDKARVRNKNGCGVGLSIVREIVEAHHGSFEAGNDTEGVFFELMIPMIDFTNSEQKIEKIQSYS